MKGSFRGIIWDWNGTLLNDTGLAVQTMNEMLEKRGLPTLSMEHYKSVFTFPVSNYYQKIGFDFQVEPFEIPANEFIVGYNDRLRSCSLHQDALLVLGHFRCLCAKLNMVCSTLKLIVGLFRRFREFSDRYCGFSDAFVESLTCFVGG